MFIDALVVSAVRARILLCLFSLWLLQLREAEAEYENAEYELQQIKAQQVLPFYTQNQTVFLFDGVAGATCSGRRKFLAGAACNAAASSQRTGRRAGAAAANRGCQRAPCGSSTEPRSQ